MRLVTYLRHGGEGQPPRIGAMQGGDVLDLADLALSHGTSLPHDMLGLIAGGPAVLQQVRGLLEAGGVDLEDRPHLLAPIPRPPKGVIGIGLNYAAHVEESARAMDTTREVSYPVVFIKPPTAVTGPDTPIAHPAFTKQLDWESELGVVIGTRCKDVAEADAMGVVFGYTCINDISARDLRHGGQWTFAKGLDGFAPMGPWIVTADEVPDPHALRVQLHVNGVPKQDGNSAQMIFRIPRLIAHLSSGMTLEPGDVIATGSPEGVGISRTPPEFLHPGETVEVTVERIGTLRNTII